MEKPASTFVMKKPDKLLNYLKSLNYKPYSTIPWDNPEGNDLPAGIVLHISPTLHEEVRNGEVDEYTIVGDKSCGCGWMTWDYDKSVTWVFWIPQDAEWAWLYSIKKHVHR